MIDLKWFYNRLQLDKSLEPGDERWVDLSPATEPLRQPLTDGILKEEGFTAQLVTGFRGTGKSTELKQIGKALRDDGFTVVYSEADPLHSETTPIDVGEVLAYLAYALWEHGFRRRLFERLLGTAGKLAPSGVEVKEAELSAGLVKLRAALRRQDLDLAEKVREVARRESASLARELEEAVGHAQKQARRSGSMGLVLILDALDKVAGHPWNAAEVEESVRHVLLERAELRRLPCHLILTVPPTMVAYPRIDELYSGPMLVMPVVRVRDRQEKPDPQGVRVMKDFVAARAGEMEQVREVFGADLRALVRLIVASGGHLRRLQQLLRTCIAETRALPVSVRLVDEVVARASRPFGEALYEEYREPLRAMMASDEQRFRRSQETRPLLHGLLREGLLLRYHNQEYWEALHPLALRHLDRKAFNQLLDETEQLAEQL